MSIKESIDKKKTKKKLILAMLGRSKGLVTTTNEEGEGVRDIKWSVLLKR